MNPPPVTLPFYVSLNPSAKEPLYKQLSEKIRCSIETGKLSAGQLLPATRNLAQELGLSRFTVVESYRTLMAQGYLEADRGMGSRVCRDLPQLAIVSVDEIESATNSPTNSPTNSRTNSPMSENPAQLSSYARRLLAHQTEYQEPVQDMSELNFATTPSDLLPLKHWRKSLSEFTQNENSPVFANRSDPQGYLPLREAIAGYVRRSRSVKTSPEQIVVFPGYQSALECITRIFIEPGDLSLVENPSNLSVSRTLRNQGAAVKPVSFDRHGPIASVDEKLPERPSLIFSTPSLQEPNGLSLSLPTRLALLECAKKQNAYIVEDDTANEYHYGGRPMPALQSLDLNGNVLFLNAFSNTLYPIVRLAYLVLPLELVPIVNLAKSSCDCDLPTLEQCVLADLISSGRLEHHILKSRSVYNARRRALIKALTKHLRGGISILRESSGTELLVRFQATLSDEEILTLGRAFDFRITKMQSVYFSDTARTGEFLWSFRDLSEDSIDKAVGEFSKQLNQLSSF
jgi:GntR family transcriptional regulator/MocR family aminotransferase